MTLSAIRDTARSKPRTNLSNDPDPKHLTKAGRKESSARHWLFASDGHIFQLEQYADGHVELEALGEQSFSFHGRMAEALLALAAGTLTAEQRLRLAHAAVRHPQLTGLEQARAQGMRPDRVLLGSGLGLAFIELTARCNERCLHCYADASPERGEQLPFGLLRDLLDQLVMLDVQAVQFTGGDPLLYDALPEALAYARHRGIESIEIYTNGLALSARLLAQLSEYEPDFAFSVYSHKADVHDRITDVAGSHRRTLAAIRRVLRAGLKARASVVCMRENASDMQGTFALLHEELGLPPEAIRFDRLRITGRGREAGNAPVAGNGGHLPQMDAGPDPTAPRTPPMRRGKLCIAANGDLHPCIFSRHIRLGNVHRESIQEIIGRLQRYQTGRIGEQTWFENRAVMTCADCRVIASMLQHLERNDV